jgi:predicted short-subunit dehydrogenase-like oxidoreductase (DUF2520 family)
MKSLTIIGCGVVGKVLGRLFHDSRLFEIRDILNRSLESGRQGAAFIGAGRAVSGVEQLRPADLYLIAASDDAIAGCAAALAASGSCAAGAVVCHLSGALPSTVLAPLRDRGAAVASVHPVKSFADPSASVADFAGTWCGVEGDASAVALLSEAFAAIGGRLFPVDTAFKSLYHAGSVLVCNYLTALIEVGVTAYEKGGLPRETALQVMEPLVRGTLDNVFRVGTAQALTGPIARGDLAVVAGQLAALEGWDSEVALVYRVLGRVAVDLSRRKGAAADGDLAALQELLSAKA